MLRMLGRGWICSADWFRVAGNALAGKGLAAWEEGRGWEITEAGREAVRNGSALRWTKPEERPSR